MVLRALKAAADAYHRRRQHGSATIAYGTTNYKLAKPGGDFRDMSLADAAAAGRDLAQVARDLRCYQRGTTAGGCPSPASGHDYRHQRAALAGDIEMNWEQATISRQLVSGVRGRTASAAATTTTAQRVGARPCAAMAGPSTI